MKYNTHCYGCDSLQLTDIIDLGLTPLSDTLLSSREEIQNEKLYPLTLTYCEDCSLFQIRQEIVPSVLFHDDYPYATSVSSTLTEHFASSAFKIIKDYDLNSESCIIEIGSNDGCLIGNFHRGGMQVLGIDPVKSATDISIKKGIPTLRAFFDEDLALDLKAQGVKADVVLANNVLAHVRDINGVLRGVRHLLKPDGVLIIEVPYVLELFRKLEFDTIYHQHMSYFSLESLNNLAERAGMGLKMIEYIATQGGSLRITFGKDSSIRQLNQLILEERDLIRQYVSEFSGRVRELRRELIGLLRSLKRQNKSIAGYGAAAKANTLMSYCNIDDQLIEYLVDANPTKQGKFMSGNHLAIYSPEKLFDKPPDYILILPWNLKNEIMNELSELRSLGVKFIIPLPKPEIVI